MKCIFCDLEIENYCSACNTRFYLDDKKKLSWEFPFFIKKKKKEFFIHFYGDKNYTIIWVDGTTNVIQLSGSPITPQNVMNKLSFILMFL